MRSGLRYTVAYLMWFAVLASGLWLALVCRETLLEVLARYAGESTKYLWQARFFHHCFIVVTGLCWVILTVAVEEYFRRGVQRRDLVRRFAKVAGPMLLFILVADLCLLGLQGGSSSGWRWLSVVGECVIGLSFLLFGRFSRSTGDRKP